MKILIVHTYYQRRGGEDISYELEKELLKSKGYQVAEFERTNHLLEKMSPMNLMFTTIWNHLAYCELSDAIKEKKPDLLYVTNTFPYLSPSIYYAAFRANLPVIQSVHNFRYMCLNGFFLRRGKICEKCKGVFPWYGILYRCYRDSYLASSVVAMMIGLHRKIGTYEKINGFITLTHFTRQKFIEGGIPPEKIFVKPNFLEPDPKATQNKREGAVFVGRLSQEKGLEVLINAWKLIGGRLPLKILGDGPLRVFVERVADSNQGIYFLGERSSAEVIAEISKARFLVFSSQWYEHFPRVFLEAFSTGTPIIASKLGAAEELIKDKFTGLHFQVGDHADLAEKVKFLLANEDLWNQMSVNARKEYLEKYTAQRNSQIISEIFQKVLENSR